MERKCLSVMLRIVLLYTIISSVHCDCGPPPDIHNSRLKSEFQGQTTFSPGFSVKYECHPGYTTIFGKNNFVICMSDSSWSPSEEFCTLKRCPHPGDIDNGYFEGESFFFGSKVTYFCNDGYKMQSKRNYRDCIADGTWSNTKPVCEAAICPPPPTIPGGSFSPWKSEYQYRDSVTYNCNDRNAVMEQHDSLFCTENGDWSNTEPRCTVVDCPSPNVPNSKKLSGFYGPYRLNFVVEFECNKGFNINGSKTIQCTIQNTWDPPPPKCTKLYCPEPELENGTIISGNKTDGSYDVKDSVTLGCDQGYRLRGQKNLTCGEDFQWTPEMPNCDLEGCKLPVIQNGHVTKKNGKVYNPEKDGYGFSLSDDISIACDESYQLNGINFVKCFKKILMGGMVFTGLLLSKAVRDECISVLHCNYSITGADSQSFSEL